MPCDPIFPEYAARALEIFKSLRVVDLPGKPTFGECSEEWVFEFVAAIFGAYDEESGKQLIREFFLLISKKNTKSTIAAGIMLTALILNWREDEELLILAPTIEVAQNSFKPAAGMVRADDELNALFHIQDHTRTITHRGNRSALKVVAADSDTVSGKKSGKVLIDELWVLGKRQNADAMLMEATGGQVSRDEGWVILLSTQSDEPPAGVFKEKLEYYRDVRDGKIVDPKSLGLIYEFPQAMIEAGEHLKPENFYITNPNLGRSVSGEWLADQLTKLATKDEGLRRKFLAKHLNIEIGLALRSSRWAGAEFWEQNVEHGLTLEAVLARSEVVVAGVDGGGLDDLLGVSVLGREAKTGCWLHWAHAWAHPIALKRNKQNESKYRDFIAAGELTVVKNVGEDVDAVAGVVQTCEKAGVLDQVGVDQAGIGSIVDAIVEKGIKHERIVGIPQGWKLTGAIKTTERRLAASSGADEDPEAQMHRAGMRHGGSALMAWCVGNALVEPRGNAIVITKAAAGTGKIDPLMATFNAAALMAMNPKARKKKLVLMTLG